MITPLLYTYTLNQAILARVAASQPQVFYLPSECMYYFFNNEFVISLDSLALLQCRCQQSHALVPDLIHVHVEVCQLLTLCV